MKALRPAVFLDRDGTLNVDQSVLLKPEEMRILPGVGAALKLLHGAGFARVVVSNQSAVGRGMMSAADLDRIHDEMNRQLAEVGATLDGIYVCTFAPLTNDPLAIEHPDRKPAPGMLLRAATELRLDVNESWMVGDSLRDILAGQNAGCKGCILVRTGEPIDETRFGLARPFEVMDDLLAAARHIVVVSGPPGR